MVNQFVEQRLGLSRWKAGRLTQLLLLAVSVLTYSVIAMAVANSLFVSHAGAKQLPIAFIAIGSISMPAYALFSHVVDRHSRPQLFRYALLLSVVLMVGLRLLLNLESPYIYYLLLVVVFFQWDFHNSILYPSLLTDYFTALEYKRYAPYIGIAQAVGTLLGGSLTALLSHYLRTRDLLLCLPIGFAIAFAQLIYLETSQQQLEKTENKGHVGLIDALKSFPDLAKRYPIVLFLAGSSFLLVIVYLSSEYLWFNIYSQRFSEDELTGFLGLMRVIVSILQVIVLYCLTRPLLHWIGVARMNVVYPLTTLASFLNLLLNFNLGAAIILQLNGDSLYKSINLPVHQLNYNAVPREFLGRVRALSDGLIYAVGLTLAGVVLLVARTFLDLMQITELAMGLAFLLLLLRLPMGKLYGKGLEATIRSDTIDLDEFSDYPTTLPPQPLESVRELIAQEDRYAQIKGLELAATLGQPSQFFDDVQGLLGNPDADIRHAIVKLFSTNPDGETLQQFEQLLSAETIALQAIALEVLIANRYPFEEDQVQDLLDSDALNIRALAAVAASQIEATDRPAIGMACDRVWQVEPDETAAQAMIRAISQSRDRKLAPLLQCVLVRDSSQVKREALDALATLVRPGDREFAEIAIAELDCADPFVRASACNVLGAVRGEDLLPHLAQRLGDPDPRVRQRATIALAAFGRSGLTLAKNSLSSEQPEVVQAAIAAIGQVRTKRASNILFEYLSPEFQGVIRTHKWQQQIPLDIPAWQPLHIAIEDFHQRAIQNVLYVLSCMGNSRTVNTVNRILNSTNSKDLANAVEVLASLRHRRFILPLMPILEQLANQEQTRNNPAYSPQWLRTKGYKLLLELLESKDRWIRVGALIALAAVPSALMNDPDPFVKTVAKQIFQSFEQFPSIKSTDMNRLLLLKTVALFKNLSLDELLLIDKALEQEQILAGTTIFSEGSWCTHFYIIAAGRVRIVKDIDGETRDIKQLSMGQHFGEVALFDDSPHWDGAIAVEDCILLKLDKNRFINLITQRPHIILEICRFLSQRLRETDRYRSAKKWENLSEFKVQK